MEIQFDTGNMEPKRLPTRCTEAHAETCGDFGYIAASDEPFDDDHAIRCERGMSGVAGRVELVKDGVALPVWRISTISVQGRVM